MFNKINSSIFAANCWNCSKSSRSTNKQNNYCDNVFEFKNNNVDIEDYFVDALNQNNETWEVDLVNSRKAKKDVSETIYLSKDEQKKVEELVEKYEKYRASLSPEDREILDKNKKIGINSSRRISDDKWKDFQDFYNKRDFSKMTKSQLLDLLQYTDTTDMGVDGKIGSFRQGQIGDCWLMAALRNISHSKEYSETIKNSITKNDDGSYTVKFKGINRYIEEQANGEFSNKFWESETGRKMIDEVEKKFPDAKEIDYFKILSDENYEPKNDAEKYFLSLVEQNKEYSDFKKNLLSEKEKFVKEKEELFKDGITISKEKLDANYLINEYGNEANYSTGDQDVTLIEMAVEEVRKKVNDGNLGGGSTKIANMLLLDKDSEQYIKEETLSEEQKQKWINVLENSSPEQLTASSNSMTLEEEKHAKDDPNSVFMDLNSKELGNRKICKTHVYNIAKVDKKNKIVYVENPWENGVQIPLTYDEFFSCFSQLFKIK